MNVVLLTVCGCTRVQPVPDGFAEDVVTVTIPMAPPNAEGKAPCILRHFKRTGKPARDEIVVPGRRMAELTAVPVYFEVVDLTGPTAQRPNAEVN